jgi:uroporphyrin-III C-methyltransferase/precorrin-2 dehydrogenase/sirohydrochlorin ferrochelatase
MRYFPIFVDTAGNRVVVVGGGEEALRKVRLILKTEARIEVIAPALHPELAGQSRVHWVARNYAAALLDGAALVFSADPALNGAVSADARARGIPVNAVDDAGRSSFIVPSIVDRDPVVVAIGTEGTAPVLAMGLRARIDALLPSRIGALALKAGSLRERVAALVPHGNRRRAFWQTFFFGAPRHAFLEGDMAGFERSLETSMVDAAGVAAGRISFIDAGAGDPELLTLKAQRKLQEADVIVHEPWVDEAVPELARRDAVRLPAGSTATIVATLLREARRGRNVVYLHCEAQDLAGAQEALESEGIAVDVVPAVSVSQHSDRGFFFIRKNMHVTELRAVS